jgi:hypothetical protein
MQKADARDQLTPSFFFKEYDFFIQIYLNPISIIFKNGQPEQFYANKRTRACSGKRGRR